MGNEVQHEAWEQLDVWGQDSKLKVSIQSDNQCTSTLHNRMDNEHMLGRNRIHPLVVGGRWVN